MKKYLYTIGIALFAALSSCTDSLHDDIPTLGGADEYAVSISVELVQNDPRLNFEGNYSNGIKTKFETGDKLYLYKNGTKVPNIVFEYIKPSSQENVGIFGLVGSPDTTPLNSGSFNAVLVGKNAKIFGEDGKQIEDNTLPENLDNVLANASSEGSYNGAGDSSKLGHIEIGAGVFKSKNEIQFITNNSSHPDKLWGSEHFKFVPNYSIIELTLNLPKVSSNPGDENYDTVDPNKYKPSIVSFGIKFVGDVNKRSFKLNVKNIAWTSSVFIPIIDVADKIIEQITIVVLNDADPEKENEGGEVRSYWQMGTPSKTDYTAGNVYQMKSNLIYRGLYLGYLNQSNPTPEEKEFVKLIQNAPDGAIFTVLDGLESDGVNDYGYRLDANRTKYTVGPQTLNYILRDNISKANGTIGFVFPYLRSFVGGVPTGTYDYEARGFWKVKNLYYIAAFNCKRIDTCVFYECSDLKNVYAKGTTYIGRSAFAECHSLEVFNAPDLKEIGTRAFVNCLKLKNVNYPLVDKLSEATFAGCHSLETVDLPKLEKVSGASCFMSCGKLHTVNVPSLQRVGIGMFGINRYTTPRTGVNLWFEESIKNYTGTVSDITITIGTNLTVAEAQGDLWGAGVFMGRFCDNRPSPMPDFTHNGSNIRPEYPIDEQMWAAGVPENRPDDINKSLYALKHTVAKDAKIHLIMGMNYFRGQQASGISDKYFVTNTNAFPDKTVTFKPGDTVEDAYLFTKGKTKNMKVSELDEKHPDYNGSNMSSYSHIYGPIASIKILNTVESKPK